MRTIFRVAGASTASVLEAAFSYGMSRMFILGALMSVSWCVAAQQAYPSKVIRMIVPFTSAGSVDAVARLVGEKLSKSLGQVVIDNRPGGSTIIGSSALVKSQPDGHTLMMTSTTHIMTALLIRTPYDAIRDFAPVATVTKAEVILVLAPSTPANNLKELIALAKSKAGQLNYGSTGTGNSYHVATEAFNALAGVKMTHVPYNGLSPLLSDLFAGRISVFVSPPGNVIPLIKSGRVKVIAVSGETRMSALPQAPTFAEAGLPGLEVRSWNGLLAPAGTPKPIIERLASEVAKIAAMADIKEKLGNQGMEPFISTPEQFGEMMKAELRKYGDIIKTAGIKLAN